MQKLNIPDGHQSVMPYLIVNNATAFLSFMQEVFGATERYKEMRDEQTIRHAEAVIGNSTIMFADSIPDWEPSPAGLFIYVVDADSAYKKALDLGATSIMPIEDKDYGRTCGIKDPFGNTWWITSVK